MTWPAAIFIILFAFALLFGGIYVTTAYSSGYEAAKRTLRYVVLVFLVGGLVFALLYQLFGAKYSLFSLAVLFLTGISIWLLSWRFRKQEAGALLLFVGGTEYNQLYLAGALFWVAIVSLQTWQFFQRVAKGLPQDTSLVSSVSSLIINWTNSTLFMVLGLSKLEIRENGICFWLRFFAWQKVESYRWKHSKTSTLTIFLKSRFPFFPGLMSIPIPAQHLEAVNHILNQKLPDQNL
jgi:hypothetical protein